MSDLNNALSQSVMLVAGTQNANFNTAAIDFSPYDGVAVVVMNTGVGTGTVPTLAVSLYASPFSNAANAVNLNISFTNVANAANTNSFQTASVDTRLINASQRYVFAVATLGGTSPVIPIAMNILAEKKYRGTTQ
jgi:hypothetical protein